jgi:hypothetical protein
LRDARYHLTVSLNAVLDDPVPTSAVPASCDVIELITHKGVPPALSGRGGANATMHKFPPHSVSGLNGSSH